MPTEIVMSLETGSVTIRLRPDLAPNHVDRIVQLAADGFYDGTPFDRVSFIYQASPKSRSRYPDLKAEFTDMRMARGVCCMARGVDPDSANAGFFIMAADAAFMACQYTVWGEVVSGMEFLDALPKGEPPPHPGHILGMLVR